MYLPRVSLLKSSVKFNVLRYKQMQLHSDKH